MKLKFQKMRLTSNYLNDKKIKSKIKIKYVKTHGIERALFV